MLVLENSFESVSNVLEGIKLQSGLTHGKFFSHCRFSKVTWVHAALQRACVPYGNPIIYPKKAFPTVSKSWVLCTFYGISLSPFFIALWWQFRFSRSGSLVYAFGSWYSIWLTNKQEKSSPDDIKYAQGAGSNNAQYYSVCGF